MITGQHMVTATITGSDETAPKHLTEHFNSATAASDDPITGICARFCHSSAGYVNVEYKIQNKLPYQNKLLLMVRCSF
jgi:hypothetical protein